MLCFLSATTQRLPSPTGLCATAGARAGERWVRPRRRSPSAPALTPCAGFFRIQRGTNTLGIESDCAWGIPGVYTTSNFPCYEDGSNCVAAAAEFKAGPKHVAGAVARSRKMI